MAMFYLLKGDYTLNPIVYLLKGTISFWRTAKEKAKRRRAKKRIKAREKARVRVKARATGLRLRNAAQGLGFGELTCRYTHIMETFDPLTLNTNP